MTADDDTKRQNHAGSTACIELPDLLRLRAQWRASGIRVIWTNGCFDVFHAGHALFLAQARALGDVLIVGVNSDESVRRLKGPARPFLDFASRTIVLAGMSAVDYVVMLSEDAPCPEIELLRPDVCCKDDSYASLPLPEREVVEGYGGEMCLLPRLGVWSTTAIVDRIRAAGATEPCR